MFRSLDNFLFSVVVQWPLYAAGLAVVCLVTWRIRRKAEPQAISSTLRVRFTVAVLERFNNRWPYADQCLNQPAASLPAIVVRACATASDRASSVRAAALIRLDNPANRNPPSMRCSVANVKHERRSERRLATTRT